MSFNVLYAQPVLLGRDTHRGKRLRPTRGPGPAARLHACFIAAGEFPEAAKEYVIGFVDAPAVPGEAAEAAVKEVSPIVLLGLRQGENLYLADPAAPAAAPAAPAAAAKWDARYVPAFVRRYPFAYAHAGDGQPSVMIDAACEGLNDTDGELLVQDDGEASPFLKQMIGFLDAFEAEVQRTRALCRRIVALGLLKPVQIDVKLPDGKTLNAGGVQVIDEDRLKALPEAAGIELLRNGMLGLLHAQLISTTNVQRLTERLGVRMEAAAAAQAPVA
jgi:SapC